MYIASLILQLTVSRESVLKVFYMYIYINLKGQDVNVKLQIIKYKHILLFKYNANNRIKQTF
jgi:hypothetical protein